MQDDRSASVCEGLSAHADLGAVFAAIPGMNLLLAPDAPRFTMLLASDERLAATMSTREGTLGRPLFDVFADANPANPSPSGVQNLRASLETVLRTGEQHCMPLQRYDLQRANGSWEERYWSPTNVPVKDANGNVKYLIHQVTDVTEAVLGRAALERAEQGAARVLGRMTDAHFQLDGAFRLVEMNPAAERMTGTMRHEVLGLTCEDAFPASFDPAVDAAFRRVVASGREEHLLQHYVSEGSDVYVEVDAYSTDDGGVAIFARDVSERVSAVETRREMETQRFLTRLGDVLHREGDTATLYEGAARLLGEHLGSGRVLYAEAREEDNAIVVVAQHLREGLVPVARDYRFDDYCPCVTISLRSRRTLVMTDVTTEAQLDVSERMLIAAAGVGASVTVPILQDGRIAACLSVVQPTSRKWTSHEVALIEETAQRTAIAAARSRAEAALRASDRRKDEFLAVLAHELRNPLAPVRNGLQILRMAPHDTQKTNKVLGVMDRQLTHMTRLIDDLLDVSRFTSGKVVLRRERIPLRAVFDNALEASLHLIEASRHVLMSHFSHEALFLDADATRLVQVVGNLINNAVKYTPDGGQIDLFGERDGNDVLIRVRDTGVGISSDMLPHVFDLFAQVSGSSLARAQGGLGIGLSISRQLIHMHGGTLRAESDGLGKGATFTVRLPMAAEPESERAAPGAATEAENLASQEILVVDDNIDAADSFTTMLELSGHVVTTVYTGADALAAVAKRRPSLVFCDIGMPGMNGYEVAERIRADASLAPVRLIAVTGWGRDEDKRLALEAGFDAHLAKPIAWAAVEAVLTAQEPGEALLKR
ncbi:hybrid sensor histidine kinase/response regulator [Pigmentiphaga aceris]|uniref:hybrid sensor histidine kinase/response regulator n=1 Tax=Pigmentiphaga aceris TaxID=1940612 RepID=UPI0016527BBF|nr:ATP-binding protein [Pigmentiphaga aceris]